ncbi:MAG: hypothetical protein R3Y67_09885 [Eubacteriales bacterium]
MGMKQIIQEPEYYRYSFSGEHFNILIQDIQYFESRGRIIQIHMKSGEEMSIAEDLRNAVRNMMCQNQLKEMRGS